MPHICANLKLKVTNQVPDETCQGKWKCVTKQLVDNDS